ncbi:MAG: PC4/YdbC family ssDNA-binding protein [Bacillota bacterium]|nr:PC4/YdbC family ssDNA-binding protein [Bacillota bacterium]
MDELKYEIKKNLIILSESTKGWRKEVNVISWNEGKPKLDIRDWDGEHKKMGKGVTLNKDEVAALGKYLKDTNFDTIL